jgi:5'-3' exonuclease
MSDILIIDGSNFFVRALYGMSSSGPLTNSQGQETTAIYNFLVGLRLRVSEEKPEETYIIFDFGRDTRKKQLYKDYKANRDINLSDLSGSDYDIAVNKSESFKRQKSVIIDILKTLPVKLVLLQQIEGDSLMAYVARHFSDRDKTVTIVSNDRDFYQLLCKPNICMWNPHKKIKITQKNLTEVSKVDIPPPAWRVFKSIIGDKGDNIIGLPNIGLKRGQEILDLIVASGHECPTTIDQLFTVFDESKDHPEYEKLVKKFGKHFTEENKKLLAMNYELVDLLDCTFSPQALSVIYKAIESKPFYSKMEFVQHLIRENINSLLASTDKFIDPFTDMLPKERA